MASEMTLNGLIAALEKATGPDRELDCAIGALVGLNIHHGNWHLVPNQMEDRNDQVVPIPFYTASIDAARMLVSEGWNLIRIYRYDRNGAWRATIIRGEDNTVREVGESWADIQIALCIAALRVRLTPPNTSAGDGATPPRCG